MAGAISFQPNAAASGKAGYAGLVEYQERLKLLGPSPFIENQPLRKVACGTSWHKQFVPDWKRGVNVPEKTRLRHANPRCTRFGLSASST